MAVTAALPPPPSIVVAASSSGAGTGGGGGVGIVHQGTLLNVVKNIFPDHGMYEDALHSTLFIL